MADDANKAPPPGREEILGKLAQLLVWLEENGTKVTPSLLVRLLGRVSWAVYLLVGGLLVSLAVGAFSVGYMTYPWRNPPTSSPVAIAPAPVVRKQPSRITFSAEVYRPGSHARWLDEIKARLQEEGNAEKSAGIADFRIVWVKTEPWADATPKMTVRVAPALNQFLLAGYGFVVHSGDEDCYQALAVRREAKSWDYATPECNKGDKLVFVFRLSSSTAGLFPKDSNLANLFEITLK